MSGGAIAGISCETCADSSDTILLFLSWSFEKVWQDFVSEFVPPEPKSFIVG